MANIQIGTAAGTTLGNPPSGDFYIFIDSDNVNAYTLRDSSGMDTILVQYKKDNDERIGSNI